MPETRTAKELYDQIRGAQPILKSKKTSGQLSVAMVGGIKPTTSPFKRRESVRQLDKAGNMIAEYYSQSQAAITVGVAPSAISQCISGKNQTAGGFRWERIVTD